MTVQEVHVITQMTYSIWSFSETLKMVKYKEGMEQKKSAISHMRKHHLVKWAHMLASCFHEPKCLLIFFNEVYINLRQLCFESVLQTKALVR